MMQDRARWLTKGGAGTLVTLAALTVGAGGMWMGCDAGNTGNNITGSSSNDDDGGAAGAGGTTEMLPCGIDCSTIQTTDCSEAVCDETTKQCAIVPLNDVECDDGLFCTVGDTCVEGTCTGTGQNNCNLEPPSWSCQAVVCDEASKSCSQTPVAEGTECIASDPCVVGATCDANNLCTGPTNDCFFANTPDACHVSVCSSQSGECEPVPGNDGLPCLDGLCTQEGVCGAGSCNGAIAKDCSFVTNACNAGSCDAMTGGCVQTPTNEGGVCTDQDGCTFGDLCAAGDCAPGAVVSTCTDDDGCCGPTCDGTNDNDCQKILLFGDDLPISGWQAYRDALIAAGRQWDESNYDFPNSNQGMFPDATQLANYDTVIIAAESSTDWPDADNQSLIDWLQDVGQERNLLIIGKDIIWDFNLHSPGNAEYDLLQLFGLTYNGSSAGTLLDEMVGVQSDPITDAFFTTPIRLTKDGNSSGDYADPAIGPATHIGIYSGPSGSGLNKSAMTRYAPSYQLVWLGFNMHDGIVNRKDRNALMVNIMEWFKQ